MSALSEGTPGWIHHVPGQQLKPCERGSYDKLTVAEYMMLELHTNHADVLYSSPTAATSSLNRAAQEAIFDRVVCMQTPKEAMYAAIAYAKERDIGAVVLDEKDLLSISHDVAISIDESVPVAFIIITSHIHDHRRLIGLPESAERGLLMQLKACFEKSIGAYVIVDDRRTAGARIDRAIDIVRDLKLPAIIEIYEEVAQAIMPHHIYRKTIFNHEEHDLFEGAWETILSRISHASRPLLAIGRQVRSEEWLSLLLSLADRYDAYLYVDAEVLCEVPLSFSHRLQPIPLHPNNDRELYDSIFCFGIDSENIWLTSLLEEHYLSEDSMQELISVNSSSLIFGDGKDPFSIFCLEEFFHAAPPIDTSAPYRALTESRSQQKPIQTPSLPSPPSDLLAQLNHILPSPLPVISEADPMGTIWLKAGLFTKKILQAPDYPSPGWVEASIIGIYDSRKYSIIAIATPSIERAEKIGQWWEKEHMSKAATSRLLILLLIPIERVGELATAVSNTAHLHFFQTLAHLKEWLSDKESPLLYGIVVLPSTTQSSIDSI